MQKIIHYIKKILNKFVLYTLLLLIFLVSAVVLSKCNKNKDPYMQKIEEERKLINDINNTSDDNLFPNVEVIDDKISIETRKNLKENYLRYIYNNTKNQNVAFSIVIPKDWKIAFPTEEQELNPFDLTDKRTVILSEIENENLGIEGKIQVLNTTLELDMDSVNNFMVSKVLKLTPFRKKLNIAVNGKMSELLALNPENGKVTRITTIRDSSLYYIISFTFKNFYDYMKYAKDVSIIFSLFRLTNELQKLSLVEFNLLQVDGLEILFPKNWKIQNKYFKDKKYNNIDIHSKNKDMIFNIRAYDDINIDSKKLADLYINELKNKGITFEGIDFKNTAYNDVFDAYATRLLNAKDNDGNQVEVYLKIKSKDNKKILGSIITKRLESYSYLPYYETERFLDIFMYSTEVGFFDNAKLQDSNWKYLVEN